ncbi:unnamed protein product [Ceratitis capitata]|uniref:(Mediterranean fruit fly) hypothetical protein n=1 Tax=Ceratitis capitata TaxID=7213 RepID=A0A811U8J6_CERCA|nr:unnamed protein product [Ceratitis capitata]
MAVQKPVNVCLHFLLCFPLLSCLVEINSCDEQAHSGLTWPPLVKCNCASLWQRPMAGTVTMTDLHAAICGSVRAVGLVFVGVEAQLVIYLNVLDVGLRPHESVFVSGTLRKWGNFSFIIFVKCISSKKAT